MAKRSLQASATGIEKARGAFKRTGWTQEYLAAEVGLETRQSIWKFFTGKPIERHTFIEICFQLGLDWQEIANLPLESQPELKAHDWDIAELVQVVRSRLYDKIQAQCGTIRLLDISQPIELNDIYVSVNILEAIASLRRLEVSDLQTCNLKKFNRFGLGQITQERVPALQAVATYPKLMVLGKPGSGKSTFLQSIAVQCNQGEFQPDRIPIFIRLKNFVEDARESGKYSLLSYIRQEIDGEDIPERQVETLLRHGSTLILLDGLDEVPERESHEVLRQIRQLSEEYYKNQFIITCRIAAQPYQFEGFTDIEIADFDQAQIAAFAKKWFVVVSKKSKEEGLAKAAQFMDKLQLPENRKIRELVTTPLLLTLACSVFTAKVDFPTKHADLYKQGLDILLTGWDEAKGIQRDAIYRHLSLHHKIKLLSQIATTTFEQGSCFFEQSTLHQQIADYLRSLPNAQIDPEALQLDSQAVLKSIQVQHGLLVEQAKGIYSFSHPTFREYLTARNVVASPDPQVLDKNLSRLVSHMTEPRWREVILLTASMLGNADALLQSMKRCVDGLMAADQKLQQFLVWLQQKSLAVQVPYKSAAVRAFYLTLTQARELNLARDLNLALALDLGLAGNLAFELTLDLALDRALTLSLTLPENPILDRILTLGFALPLNHDADNFDLGRSLQHLNAQIPSPDAGSEKLKAWWQANGQAWAAQLRTAMIRYRNIGHAWQFSDRQRQTLRQYYEANRFLLDSLNSDCQVTPAVCNEIQETLLLPVAEQ
jgi:predicted NACHT family NTPase